MICRIRAGSLTTDSLSAIGLCPAMADSVSGSVTVQPWSRKSPVSSSMNTAGQWSPPVSGSMPMKRSAMRYPLLVALRIFAPFQGHPDDLGQSSRGKRENSPQGLCAPGTGLLALFVALLRRLGTSSLAVTYVIRGPASLFTPRSCRRWSRATCQRRPNSAVVASPPAIMKGVLTGQLPMLCFGTPQARSRGGLAC